MAHHRIVVHGSNRGIDTSGGASRDLSRPCLGRSQEVRGGSSSCWSSGHGRAAAGRSGRRWSWHEAREAELLLGRWRRAGNGTWRRRTGAAERSNDWNVQQWARDSGTRGGRGTRTVAWLGADRARGRSEAPEANDGGARRAALDAKEVEQRKGRSGRGWRAAWSLTSRTRSMAPTAPGTAKTGGSSRPAPDPGKRQRERSSARRSLGAGR